MSGKRPSRRRPLARSVLAVLCAIPPAGVALGAPPPIANPVVFVQQQPVAHSFATISDLFGNFQGYDPAADQPVGGALVRLDPDGTLSDLTGMSGVAVRDPEVSFDGSRILFSMKIGGSGRWQVWEVGASGENLRKVSRDAGVNDLDPAYLSDGRIVFTTDRNGWADGYQNVPSAQIAVMDAGGGAVEVLKQHMAGQFNPLLGSDGMLYFTQWDFHDRRVSASEELSGLDVNRFLLWKIFADGSGLDHPTFGAHTLRDFAGGYVEIREIPGAPGTFVGLLADEVFTYGGGSIVRLEPRANQNLEAPVFLTEDVFENRSADTAGRWRSPYPLQDGRIVAAYASGPVLDGARPLPHWRLVVLAADGAQQTLYEDPELWCWQPVELTGRSAPAIAPGASDPEYPYAVINSFDVTLRGVDQGPVVNGDFQPVPAHGEIKSVRVLREDARSPNYYDDFPAHDDPDVEVLGTAPVFPDGSFAVVVPADTPVQWELLDAAGEVVVRERYGTELEAGELRQCAGCHTPHDGGVGRTTNLALAQPTNLSGLEVDRDGDGVVDLLAALAGTGSELFADGFESGDLAPWSARSPG